jgi:tetratricopeptide (TPR) repeat protein
MEADMVRLFLRLCTAAALIAPSLPLAAAADADLSDRLTDQILQLYQRDFARELDREFEQRKKALGETETVERANRLRALLKKRADTYETLEQFDRAESDHNARVEVRPLDPIVYCDRGYFYMRQSRYSDAARDFLTGSRLQPNDAVFNYGAGRALARMGAYDGSIEQYAEAIRLAPNDGLPRLSRAEALVELGRFDAAHADYDRALALGLRRESDRFFAYFGRGYDLVRLGDYDGAVRDMNAALQLRPGMVNALVWRGYARELLGQRASALDDYEAALRLSPDNGWIRASIQRMRS